MGSNPGGVFSNWRGQNYNSSSYSRRDPYAFSYSKSKPRLHDSHNSPGVKCWCGHYTPRKREVMSSAIWCDAGNHAFSSNDEKRHRMSETKMEKDPDYRGEMREVTVTVDVCGPCWETVNPFRKSPEPTEIPENEEYLRGYKDGYVKGETIS